MIFFNWVMMWQLPLDGLLGVYKSMAPSDVSGLYDSTMGVGNGGSWSSGLA